LGEKLTALQKSWEKKWTKWEQKWTKWEQNWTELTFALPRWWSGPTAIALKGNVFQGSVHVRRCRISLIESVNSTDMHGICLGWTFVSQRNASDVEEHVSTRRANRSCEARGNRKLLAALKMMKEGKKDKAALTKSSQRLGRGLFRGGGKRGCE
jgi:hypothetical protein